MSGLSNSIPDEICIEILERLSVKSLLRFKATCKPWKSLISHPSFVDHHLNRSAARCKKLVIFEELDDNSLVQLLDFGSTTNREPTTMEFPSTIPSKLRNEFGGRYLFRCSSWGGLLLLGSDSVDGEFSILLCNPSTRQIRKIPNSPNYKHHNFHHALALGYDFTVQSYMVVTIGQRFGFSYSSPYEIAVYNVKKKNLWTAFGEFRYNDDPSLMLYAYWRYSLTLVNGAPHWMKVDFLRGYEIAYFDFSKNELMRIPKPSNDADNYKNQFPHLFDMEGRLCIGYFPSDDKFKVEIWVMMEHGVGESWTRLAISRDQIPASLHRPISFAKDGMVSLVLEDNSRIVAIYTGQKRRTEIKTTTHNLFILLASSYVESLVSI